MNYQYGTTEASTTNHGRYIHRNQLGGSEVVFPCKIHENPYHAGNTLLTRSMAFFPLLNFLFLIILYRIHRRVFWVTATAEVLIHVIGFWYIYGQFSRTDNQLLYIFALTGIGFIVVLLAFFIAAFLNQKHLTSHHE